MQQANGPHMCFLPIMSEVQTKVNQQLLDTSTCQCYLCEAVDTNYKSTLLRLRYDMFDSHLMQPDSC